jgi:hypothetical protein
LLDDPLSPVLRGAGADRLIFPDPDALGRHAVGFTFLLILPYRATGAPAVCSRVLRSLSARAILT